PCEMSVVTRPNTYGLSVPPVSRATTIPCVDPGTVKLDNSRFCWSLLESVSISCPGAFPSDLEALPVRKSCTQSAQRLASLSPPFAASSTHDALPQKLAAAR